MGIFKVLFLISLIHKFVSSAGEESHKTLYKRIYLNFIDWKQFIHGTTNYYAHSTIECGSVCNSYLDQCDVFVYHQEINRCHVGLLEMKSDYLNGYAGIYPVFFSYSKLIKDLNETYLILTDVHDESYWQQFIYKTKSLEWPADHADCSFLCKNLESNTPCDLFVFAAGTCYLGLSTNKGEGIGITLLNATLYGTENSLEIIKENALIKKSNVISSHWTAHIKQKHQNKIGKGVQCHALAVLEYWHYTVHDSSKNICYFGIISFNSLKGYDAESELQEGEIKSLTIDDETSRVIQINAEELKFFQENFFTERSSKNIYQPFTYNSFSGIVNKVKCSIHCAFDSNSKCDFFYIHHHKCYLGSFNQENGISVTNSHETITTYIYKEFINDMMITLYYTSVDVLNKKWSAHLREKFITISNLECGGHAALANNAIDYWIWINGTCYLGDLAHDSDVHMEDDSNSIITIHRGNSWSDMDNLYNQKFTLSDYIWTKYTFDSISMQQDEDQIECGIRCEFSKDHCDFFTVDSGECHLGRYDHWDLGTVQSTSSPMTYHKEDLIQWVKNDYFIWWSSGYFWYKWIYKIENRNSIWKCFFECHHDEQCDFFVDVHSYCCFGDFHYTGSTPITWTDDVTLYVKKGQSPDSSIINDYFNDAYGSSAQANSVLSWWPYGIWGQYDNVETEEQCAFRCYIRKVDSCAFYYWGESYCHLGHFDGTWHYLTGSYDGDTKYHIRKDYDFDAWMYSHNHGHTNDGECLGYGYTKLTYSGQYIDLSSGNPYGTYQYYYAPYFTYYTYWYYYGDNERCYWGIYAPGATKLRFELTTNLDTYSSGDYLNVYLGVGRGGYNILSFNTYHQSYCCWEYEAELMTAYWYTDNYGTDYGWKARITRIG